MSKITKEQLDELIAAYARGEPKISDEEWKIINYRDICPNMYEVSNRGNIRKAKTKTAVPTHIWGAGYVHVRLNIKESGKSRLFTVHRIVGWHFVSGYSKKNCIINHIDGNKTNNNWYNLEWCTQKHNAQHAFDIGLKQKRYGDSSIRHFVNEETVDRICKMLVEHNGHIKPILDILNSDGIYCTFDIIECIKSKETWVEISDKYFSKDYFKNKQVNEIEIICRSIVKHEGDIKSVLNELKDVVPYISDKLISDIKCGTRFPKISIKYFEPNQFKRQVYFNEKQARMICESLVKYKGDSQKVYTELKDIVGENLTIARIEDIKRKGSYMNISDEYFKKSELNKGVIDTDSLDFIRSLLILDVFKGSPMLVYNALNHEKYPRITESIISMIKCGNHQSYLRSNKYDLNKYYDDMDKHNFIPVSKELIDRLIKSYSSGSSDIDDSTYDVLLEEYIAEHGEEARPFNRNKQSSAVNDIVGTLPKLYGVKKPMREGMPTFEKWLKTNGDKIYKVAVDDTDSNIIAIQPKFDGCSVAFDTKSNRFFTRGDYDNGESLDVTELFKDRITNISLSFNNVADYDDVDAVKFEAIMDEETYNDYLASGKFPKPYKTPRSAVSAIISGRIKELVDTITLIPLRYYINGEQKLHPYLAAMSRTVYFDSIESDRSSVEGRIEDALTDAQMFIDSILGNNASVCYHGDYYACDGVVASVLSNKTRCIDTKYEVAIKILENIKETKLIDIKWQYGKGGNITPVAVLEPVKFGNITVTNCGLGSFGRVSSMGLKRHDTVRIMHNIVPYFVSSGHDGDEIIPMPTTCPVCGAKLSSNVVKVIRCHNPNCAGLQMGNIIRYAETMKMFGVGEGVISKLFNMGYIKSISDLYKIDADKLMHEPGFGETSVKKMINSIEEASTNVPVERWLGALPITAVSVVTWRNILDEVYGRDVAAGDEIRRLIQKLNYDEFINMINVYNSDHNVFYVKAITNYFKNNWTEVHDLIDHVTFSSTNNIGTRGLVVISGTRDKILIDRLKKLGYNVTDQFNKNAIAVLVPSYNFQSSKTKKANKYGIEVIEILEFIDRFYGGGF